MSPKLTIGQQIAKARTEAGLSLDQVSAAIAHAGISDERGKPLTLTGAALSRIEAGGRLPGYRTLIGLAHVLAVWIVIDPSGDVTITKPEEATT